MKKIVTDYNFHEKLRKGFMICLAPSAAIYMFLNPDEYERSRFLCSIVFFSGVVLVVMLADKLTEKLFPSIFAKHFDEYLEMRWHKIENTMYALMEDLYGAGFVLDNKIDANYQFVRKETHGNHHYVLIRDHTTYCNVLCSNAFFKKLMSKV